MTIPTRLKEAMGSLTVEAFATLIDERPQRIKDVLRGKQKLPEDLLVKLVTQLDLDANWLLLGKPPDRRGLEPREVALLDNYRHSTEEGRRAAEATLSALAQRKSPRARGR